jgi:hypothetical protein
MNGRTRWAAGGSVVFALVILAGTAAASYIEEEFEKAPPARVPPEVRLLPPPPAPSGHVPELARYLDRLEVRRPLVYARLAVYPLALSRASVLQGQWLTLDSAIAKGILAVYEREGGGTVPFVVMENRSSDACVFAMAGEVISGGKQTRTLRQDVILAPGRRIDVPVFCVEQHRWAGKAGFAPGEALVPQSIQKEMRKGADQSAVWGEVAQSNAALGAESPTGSLEAGLRAPPVRRELDEVRRTIVPEVPRDCVGFIFADRETGGGLGAEFFGRSDLALALLPKLLDAYAVDVVVQFKDGRSRWTTPDNVAAEFLGRIRRAGSYRSETPGSGAGIRMRAAGLVGDGVAFGEALVHFGCQVEERILPAPPPRPRILPRPQPPRGPWPRDPME